MENTRSNSSRLFVLFGLLALGLSTAPRLHAQDVQLQVTFTNLAPQDGLWIMRPWVSFHDGHYDAFDTGETASTAIERIAEDGNDQPQFDAFASVLPNNVEGFFGGPTAPGTSTSMIFTIDPNAPTSAFFSFLMMVIPGNDGFVGSDDPMSHPMFDSAGHFIGQDFTITGSEVLDAGTEVNDEIPEDTAFFGQMNPNTGPSEFGFIHQHPGFNRPGSGGILDGSFMGYTFENADFIQPGYQVALVSFQIVPEPTSLALLGMGIVGLGAGFVKRRSRRRS